MDISTLIGLVLGFGAIFGGAFLEGLTIRDCPGFDNWSWSVTLNFSATTPVHSGTNSISAQYTGAWGGIYLHRGTALTGTDSSCC